MTEDEPSSPETRENDSIAAQREAALRALGIDPACVVWPDAKDSATDEVGPTNELARLTDVEWAAICPHLPAEPPQARAMCNREFLEEVVKSLQGRVSWTSREKTARESDTIRRRFGRWAHLGVFQALEDRLAELDLSPTLRSALVLAARRAENLRRRSTSKAKVCPSVHTRSTGRG